MNSRREIFGMEAWPVPLIMTRCHRCKKNAGLWHGSLNGRGSWYEHHDNRCRCVPPPSRPQGAELDELVAEAWLKLGPIREPKWGPPGLRAPITKWV